jgi:hypothetical protein
MLTTVCLRKLLGSLPKCVHELKCTCSVAGDVVGAPEKEMRALRTQRQQLQNYSKLKELHWDTHMQSFLDWGLHTEDVALVRSPPNPVRPPTLACYMLRSCLLRIACHLGSSMFFQLFAGIESSV